jgi:hypothetical protein
MKKLIGCAALLFLIGGTGSGARRKTPGRQASARLALLMRHLL